MVSYVNVIFEPKNSRLSFTNRRNNIGLNTDPCRKPACEALERKCLLVYLSFFWICLPVNLFAFLVFIVRESDYGIPSLSVTIACICVLPDNSYKHIINIQKWYRINIQYFICLKFLKRNKTCTCINVFLVYGCHLSYIWMNSFFFFQSSLSNCLATFMVPVLSCECAGVRSLSHTSLSPWHRLHVFFSNHPHLYPEISAVQFARLRLNSRRSGVMDHSTNAFCNLMDT